jgi:hypothetical protein
MQRLSLQHVLEGRELDVVVDQPQFRFCLIGWFAGRLKHTGGSLHDEPVFRFCCPSLLLRVLLGLTISSSMAKTASSSSRKPMKQRYAPRNPPELWVRHRPRIEALFVREHRTLKDVIAIMKTRGFHATLVLSMA